MTALPDCARRLHRGHFAFMRALVQGIDAGEAWDRYLNVEGDRGDARRVRSAIAWMRSAFAAAARREQRPGTARLVLLDAQRWPDTGSAPAPPSLEEFALASGMDGFSEAEQLERYAEIHGDGGTRLSRRARMIERQLQALQWLENLAAQEPLAGDSVHAWFDPRLAARLQRADLPTLHALIQRINGVGARWWTCVVGVGPVKAMRIVQWLQTHEGSIGHAVGDHALVLRSHLSRSDLDAVTPPATALLPLEKLQVPQALDGSNGRYRSPRDRNLLRADNDHRAIEAFLSTKADTQATQRAYRREAERLLLWCVLERGMALSSLSVEDADAYMRFLADPPSSWCGPRHRQRWSPLWRPLEGPLSAVGRAQALTILRSLFGFLMKQGYLVGNPFAAVVPPRAPLRPLGSGRTLTKAQWKHVLAVINRASTPAQQLRGRAVRWLYATGLRRAELIAARCGHLKRVEFMDGDGRPTVGWMLEVVGKGGRFREVPVPVDLVRELADALGTAGRTPSVDGASNADVPVLARPGGPGREPIGYSSNWLYQAAKTVFEDAARTLEGEASSRLLQASTHWLRHSHGSHALNPDHHGAEVPIEIVRRNLGHSSIGTTSGYITSEREAQLRAMSKLWQHNAV
ncbi:Site-specific recombinase XerD [Variovorax sp. HW608]|uniref:phage integrase family protein n=1 Tax=Variovorax sp. HW608 TaxID=1034889 RepID=UPI00081F9A1A|nr:phage integrase family protein [Variovorax sp. HW608]SCK55301.1 Site-specific recombinase XerD [Variovorax sp. HW608]